MTARRAHTPHPTAPADPDRQDRRVWHRLQSIWQRLTATANRLSPRRYPISGLHVSGEQDPAVTITPYPDGPLVVRGDFALKTLQGKPIDPGRATIALCRCGKSATKPFCDGTHKAIRFRAPAAPAEPATKPP
jgi:CDGSH-type Zn-finger protein